MKCVNCHNQIFAINSIWRHEGTNSKYCVRVTATPEPASTELDAELLRLAAKERAIVREVIAETEATAKAEEKCPNCGHETELQQVCEHCGHRTAISYLSPVEAEEKVKNIAHVIIFGAQLYKDEKALAEYLAAALRSAPRFHLTLSV